MEKNRNGYLLIQEFFVLIKNRKAYVWQGCSRFAKMKRNAFELKYISWILWGDAVWSQVLKFFEFIFTSGAKISFLKSNKTAPYHRMLRPWSLVSLSTRSNKTVEKTGHLLFKSRRCEKFQKQVKTGFFCIGFFASMHRLCIGSFFGNRISDSWG